jgi:hypothetical protein
MENIASLLVQGPVTNLAVTIKKNEWGYPCNWLCELNLYYASASGYVVIPATGYVVIPPTGCASAHIQSHKNMNKTEC